MGGNAIHFAMVRNPIQIRAIDYSNRQVNIEVLVSRAVLYTSELPDFPARLLEALPALDSTLCHNDDGLPFRDEVYATEMGHVLEHVILTLLTEHGIYAKGVTEWNWFEKPEGTFTLCLFDAPLERPVLDRALEKALLVLGRLLESEGRTRRREGLLVG